MAKFMAELLGLVKKGDLKKASEMLEEGYRKFLHEDAAFFNNIPEESLTTKLLKEHNYEQGHLEVLAELFRAEGELRYAANDEPGSLGFFRKSLLLFEFIDKEQKTYSAERIEKMDLLRRRIKELS